MNAEPNFTFQDALEAEIAAKEAVVHRLEIDRAEVMDRFDREISAARIELAAFRRAAELRPAPAFSLSRPPAHFRDGVTARRLSLVSSPKGKQPGSINQKWRNIMQEVVRQGNDYLHYTLWAVAASDCNEHVTDTAARDWLTRGGGAKGGYVEQQGDGFRVTRAAIEKFELKGPLPNESSGPDSPAQLGT